MVDRIGIVKELVKEVFNCNDSAIFKSGNTELTLTEYAQEIVDYNDENDWNFSNSIRCILSDEDCYDIKEEE